MINVDKLIDNGIKELSKAGIAPVLIKGKATYTTDQIPGGDWVYLRYSSKNCTFLRSFLYKFILSRYGYVPVECQDCYKVVVRPETFEELLKLKDIMQKMDFPSKCGIEKRETVDALYGGYWYCDGFEEGKKRLEQVEFALLNTNMTPFLKRGCTEYENEIGPSDKWKIKPDQREIEKQVYDRVEIDNRKRPQTEKDINDIMAEWIRFANAFGSYKGTHNYVTYERTGNVSKREEERVQQQEKEKVV